MIWQIVHKCDFESSKIPLFARSPFLEREALVTDKEVALLDLIGSLLMSYMINNGVLTFYLFIAEFFASSNIGGAKEFVIKWRHLI